MTPHEIVVASVPDTEDNLGDCPFPGLASYNYDRRASFRGRDAEASELAAMILGRRLTVLTAGSGDGKTSLIHAGIAPLLLNDGIEVAVAEPGGQAPLAEIGKFCQDRLLLNRGRSYYLVRRLIKKLGEQHSLRAARAHCHSLQKEERQELLTGRRAARPVNLLEGGTLVTWLRDPEISDDYLARSIAAIAPPDRGWPGTDAPLAIILSFFKAATPFKTVKLRGSPKDAKESLIRLLEKAIERRRRSDDDFELVLVLDQFEEIFTQFRDAPGTSADQEGRWHYRTETIAFVMDVIRRRLPIRIVLSMRKEHYADLQAAFSIPEELAASTYHLAPLTERQALECLLQPQAWTGFPPTREQANVIVDALSVENRYIHPTLLSVVGEWLWLHPNREQLSEAKLRLAIPGAIDAFVRRAFDSPKGGGQIWSTLEKHEMLDVLDQLIIRDGSLARRGSLAESTVLDSPLRNRKLRQGILISLEKSRLVRKEMRLGGWYVEIVHERLIDSVQRLAHELRIAEQNLAELPLLLDELRTEALDPINVRSMQQRLLPIFFANAGRINLPPVLAARIIGRLLLDPRLLDFIRSTDQMQARGITKRGERNASLDSALRVIFRELGNAAESQTTERHSDPELRIAEGNFVSPAEADFMCELSEDLSDGRMLSLIVVSALLHRDTRAHQRIRHYSRLLREKIAC